MKILKVTCLIIGVALSINANAGDKKVSSEQPQAKTRDAASGLPTGKRQHKPVSSSVNSDCNGLSEKACKAKMKKSKRAKKAKKSADGELLRKRPGRKAADDKGKKPKKKPLKHEK